MHTTIKPGARALVTNDTTKQLFTVSKVNPPGVFTGTLMAFEEPSEAVVNGRVRKFNSDRMQFDFTGGTFEDAVEFITRGDLSVADFHAAASEQRTVSVNLTTVAP